MLRREVIAPSRQIRTTVFVGFWTPNVQTGQVVYKCSEKWSTNSTGSRRSRVPKSSDRKRIAQRSSAEVGRKAMAWPCNGLGNRRWQPWTDTQPLA